MKKAAPLALLGLLLLDHSPVNQSAQALVGGPFDDNQYPGANADGTYSGTLTGKNLIGMVAFGVSSAQETAGRFSVFHEGFVHYGNCAGQADLASRRVFGTLLGVAALGGDGNGQGIVETTGASGNLGSSSQSLTVRSSVEGAFQARMKGYPRLITFEGEGRLSSSANTALLIGTAAPTTPNDFVVTVPSPAAPGTTLGNPSTADVAIEGEIQVSQLRAETPFKVRGSRTSRTVYTPINNYAALAPIAPSVGATPAPTATPVATPVVVVP